MTVFRCEKCDAEHSGAYGSGRFCSQKCARSFSTSNNRKNINEKISKSLIGRKLSKQHCLKISENNKRRSSETKNKISMSVKKWHNDHPEFKEYISNLMSNREVSEDTKLKLSIIGKKRCENVDEKNRLRNIGKKGGFGKKGYTINGTYYQSTIERDCFTWLEENNIKFEAHKYIPNSTKITDVYLINENVWVEIDGIDREQSKTWLGEDYHRWLEKLRIYEQNNLNYVIVKSVDEFKIVIGELVQR